MPFIRKSFLRKTIQAEKAVVRELLGYALYAAQINRVESHYTRLNFLQILTTETPWLTLSENHQEKTSKQ